MKRERSILRNAVALLLCLAVSLCALPFAADAQAAGTDKNPTAGQDHSFVVSDDQCNHDWSDWVIVKNPTGTEDGERMRYCKINGVHTQREAIPATGETSPFLAQLTSPTETSVKLTWMKLDDAYGYEVYFAACGTNDKNGYRLVKTIEKNDVVSYGRIGLKKNTAYKAYVKAYAYKAGKKTYIGTTNSVHTYTGNTRKNFTIPKRVALTKKNVKIKKGKTYQISASVTPLDPNKKLMPESHGAKLKYVSCNTKVATVNKNGKITAKSRGTATIYVVAINGIYKTVNVTVK